MTDYGRLLRALADGGVDFIVIGGIAGIAHGSARFTQDVDVVYRRGDDNLKRLAQAIGPLDPVLRGAPPGLPFVFDETTLAQGLNFTLRTAAGDLDLLGEVPGGAYETLLDDSHPLQIFGVECLCVGLRSLIHLKRTAGRPKDFEAIAELELIAEELGRDD